MQDNSFIKRIESLCNVLQISLKEVAKETSDTSEGLVLGGLSNIPLTTIPLHIHPDEHKELLDNLDHYFKCSNIADFLHEVSQSDQGIVQPQELLEAAKFANEISSTSSTEVDARKIWSHGNIVGIVGQAGVGKTTYIKQLVQKLLQPERESVAFDVYIFYFAFHDVIFDIETTLLGFLTASCGLSNWNTSPEEDLAITNYLANKENVIILMDGYDEINITKSVQNCHPINFDQKYKPHIFINNLIAGHIFPLAKKFISSRPRQLFEMDKECIPKFVVKILGLDNKGQQGIISNVCGDNKGQVQKMFVKHSNITTLCHAPLNCILTAYFFNQTILESNTKNQHYTISDVLIKIFGSVTKHKSKKASNQQLKTKELSSIAWKMFQANEFYIDGTTVTNCGIEENAVTAFLTASNGWKKVFSFLSGFQTQKVYFSHLVLEEFFVAVHFCFFMDVKEFEEILLRFDESKYEVVAKFVYGLFNKVTIKYLEIFLPDFSCLYQWEKEKVPLLKNLIISQLNFIQNLIDDEEIFEILLQVSSWLFEMKNDKFTQQLSFPASIVIISDFIFPSEVIPFLYVLQFTKGTSQLKLETLNFEKNSLQLLCDGLAEISPKIKLTEVDWGGSKVNEEILIKLSSCFNNITSLSLWGCQLSLDSVKILSNAINSNQIKIEVLILSMNEIGDDGAECLSSSLQYIKSLYLNECGITAVGARKLSEGLQMSDSKMKDLVLKENIIGDEGAEYLSTSVQCVENLYLQQCNITPAGVKKFCGGLQRSDSKLQTLDLNKNKIGDEGAEYLSLSVQNIKKLYVNECGITAAGAKNLSEALIKSHLKMDLLNISSNKIGKEGFTAVSKILTKVNILLIGDSNDQEITMEVILRFCKEIQNLTSSIERLVIYCSKILENEARLRLKKLKVLGKLQSYSVFYF